MKALVVDDSRVIRACIGRMLRELGFTTVEANNGLEALERLGETPELHLAIVDWNMPEMDGLEFVKALRKGDLHASAPVMMVTAETDPVRMARALMAGVDEYAMKPLEREALAEKLELLGLRPDRSAPDDDVTS